MNGLVRHDKLVRSLEREICQWRAVALATLATLAAFIAAWLIGGGR